MSVSNLISQNLFNLFNIRIRCGHYEPRSMKYINLCLKKYILIRSFDNDGLHPKKAFIPCAQVLEVRPSLNNLQHVS